MNGTDEMDAREKTGRMKFKLFMGAFVIAAVITALLLHFGLIEHAPLKFGWIEIFFKK